VVLFRTLKAAGSFRNRLANRTGGSGAGTTRIDSISGIEQLATSFARARVVPTAFTSNEGAWIRSNPSAPLVTQPLSHARSSFVHHFLEILNSVPGGCSAGSCAIGSCVEEDYCFQLLGRLFSRSISNKNFTETKLKHTHDDLKEATKENKPEVWVSTDPTLPKSTSAMLFEKSRRTLPGRNELQIFFSQNKLLQKKHQIPLAIHVIITLRRALQVLKI